MESKEKPGQERLPSHALPTTLKKQRRREREARHPKLARAQGGAVNGDSDDAKEALVAAINDAIEDKRDTSLRAILAKVHYADLADYINFASYEQRQKILSVLKNKIPPEILLEFQVDILLSIMEILGKKRFALLLNQLPIEDILYVLEEFKEKERKQVISGLSLQDQKVIIKALAYPKNCAGLLMEREFVSAKSSQTVKDVLANLIGNKHLPEDYDNIFVVDQRNHPIGIVPISKLIKAKQTSRIKSIMNKHIQTIDELLDQEEVSYIFRHYDLKSAPVVNKSKRMIGVIDRDQIVEIVEEEAEEDIMKMGGINITDLYSAFFKTAKQRFPWLFFNLITACLASSVVTLFEHQISKLAILAALMPIVSSVGGNAGTQSVIVSVRAIANKDILSAHVWHVILKEVLSSFLNGVVLATIGGALLFAVHHNLGLCLVFGGAMAVNFTLAGFWGSFVPITLHRLGLDPALSAGVFVTFLTDLLGFFIFLSLATAFLTV